jgi:hypothetical protein
MKQGFSGYRIRALSAMIASVIALAVLPGASAQATVVSTSACDDSALSHPFRHWGDTSPYKLAPGGDFERGAAGWTLGGGARIVSGSEPYAVSGSAGSHSLYLPAGASAQSPYTCVNAAYPTFRLFAKNEGLLSMLAVQIVYTEPLLGQVAVPVGLVGVSGTWQPTLPMLTASAVQGALENGTADVALRFTELTGASRIDDVYVDPHVK